MTNTGTTLSFGISAESDWDLTKEMPVNIWLKVTHIVTSILQMSIKGTIFVSFDSPVFKLHCSKNFQKKGILEPVEIHRSFKFGSDDFEAKIESEKDLKGAISYSLTIIEDENTGKQFTYNVSNKALSISGKRASQQAISFVEDQIKKVEMPSYIPLLAIVFVVILRKRLKKRHNLPKVRK